MNMMRSDLHELELNAKLIDSAKVIDGYIYLSEEIALEKKQQQAKRRTAVLFYLLLAAVALLMWDRNIFQQLLAKPSYNLEEFHQPPSLGNVLAGEVVEQLDAAEEIAFLQGPANPVVPKEIVRFIDAEFQVEQQAPVSHNIVLQEVELPAENKINIDKVLASGDGLFKRDRLMSPPVHNAFARYETVLSVDPQNTRALAGIENIVNRYVYLAETVIAKNEEYKVAGLIKNAYQVGEKYMDVSVLIEQFSTYLSNDSVFEDIIEDEKGAVEVLAQDQQTLDVASHTHGEETDNVVFVADRKIAGTAYKLFQDGDMDSAERVLQNFTKLSGFWGQSNDLLLKIYLHQSKVAEAENLIYENKALETYQFAEKAARIMMTRGDSQGALNMLAAYRPEFLENKEYYALMASLYQKVGDFQRSSYWYRQLLSVDHQDARLWLGLAVSLDALNEVDDALQAFNYVRQYAQNDSAVKNYIEERELALVN